MCSSAENPPNWLEFTCVAAVTRPLGAQAVSRLGQGSAATVPTTTPSSANVSATSQEDGWNCLIVMPLMRVHTLMGTCLGVDVASRHLTPPAAALDARPLRPHRLHHGRRCHRPHSPKRWTPPSAAPRGAALIGLRRLRRRWPSVLWATTVLALSIGAAVSTYVVVSRTLLRPLDISSTDRWVAVQERTQSGQRRSELLYSAIGRARGADVFDASVGVWSPPEVLTLRRGREPIRSRVSFLTSEAFGALGIGVSIGRPIVPDDERPGSPAVAVLSFGFWRSALGADRDVVGQSLRLGAQSVVIVGVAAEGIVGLDLSRPADVFMPLRAIARTTGSQINYFAEDGHPNAPTAGLRLFGRLSASTTLASATERLQAALQPQAGRFVLLSPLAVAAIGDHARQALVGFSDVVVGVVVLLVLVSCATVAVLHEVSIGEPRSAIAIRLSLGASTARIVLEHVFEAGALVASASVVALPMIAWMLASVRGLELPGGVNTGHLQLNVDRQAILVLLSVSLVCWVVIGTSGALRLAHGRVGFDTRDGGAWRTRRRTGAWLLAGQVGVCFVLLSSAGLLVRSWLVASGLNADLTTDRVLTSEIRFGSDERQQQHVQSAFAEYAERVSALPAVESVSWRAAEGGMGPSGTLAVNGEPRRFPTIVRFAAVDPTFFSTVGAFVVVGRPFAAADDAAAPRVAVASASLARALGGQKAALGARIGMPRSSRDGPAEVVVLVGIVPDIVQDVADPQPLTLYLPLSQRPPAAVREVVIRVADSVEVIRREATRLVASVDSHVAPQPFVTLREQVLNQVAPQRFAFLVLASLAVLAFLLTAAGAYAVTDAVAQSRVHEFAIRSALGAAHKTLVVLGLRETLGGVASGLVIGVVIAAVGARSLGLVLYGVPPLEPLSLTAAALVIVVASAVSAVRPLWRSRRVDVAAALKSE